MLLMRASISEGRPPGRLARVVSRGLGVLLLGLLLPLSAAGANLLESLRGEPAPGALMIGKTAADVTVTLEGQPLALTPTGWFAFGFGRDDSGSKTLTLVRGEQRQAIELTLSPREWQVQYVEGVPKETVTPPAEQLKRIREEAALVRAARETRSALEGFLEEFIWPASGPISGVYGSQRFYNGEPRRPHFGVDIAAPTGTPVYAPASGRVTLVHPDMFFSGGTLVLDHGYGVSSTFIHLDRVLVEQGAMVKRGDLIARIGSSGRATGPHLDWRINWHEERLDPQWFLGGEGLEEVRSPAAP